MSRNLHAEWTKLRSLADTGWLLLFTVSVPNCIAGTLTVSTGWLPVPESGITVDPPGALCVSVRLAARAPDTAAVKVTFTTILLPSTFTSPLKRPWTESYCSM